MLLWWQIISSPVLNAKLLSVGKYLIIIWANAYLLYLIIIYFGGIEIMLLLYCSMLLSSPLYYFEWSTCLLKFFELSTCSTSYSLLLLYSTIPTPIYYCGWSYTPTTYSTPTLVLAATLLFYSTTTVMLACPLLTNFFDSYYYLATLKLLHLYY